MATSAAAIEAAIIARLQVNCDVDLTNEHSQLQCLIRSFAEGMYDELQNLDDIAGGPPSVGHV